MTRQFLISAVKESLKYTTGRISGRSPRVLAYHSVDESESLLSTTPEDFSAHLKYFRDYGISTTIFNKLDSLANKKEVIITFDDGYENFYKYAFPLLKKFNMTAVIFLVTDYIGCTADWIRRDYDEIVDNISPQLKIDSDSLKKQFNLLEEISRYQLLNWGQIEEMYDYGIDFQSHSCSHPFFSSIDEKLAAYEIYESRRIIESRLGNRVCCFSYPYGDLGESCLDCSLDKYEYSFAVAANYGRRRGKRVNRFVIDRAPVYSGTDLHEFGYIFSKSFDVMNAVGKLIR